MRACGSRRPMPQMFVVRSAVSSSRRQLGARPPSLFRASHSSKSGAHSLDEARTFRRRLDWWRRCWLRTWSAMFPSMPRWWRGPCRWERSGISAGQTPSTLPWLRLLAAFWSRGIRSISTAVAGCLRRLGCIVEPWGVAGVYRSRPQGRAACSTRASACGWSRAEPESSCACLTTPRTEGSR